PDPEPEPWAESTAAPDLGPMTRALARVTAIPEHAMCAARALGLSATTLRRWLGRLALGQPLRRRRGNTPSTLTPPPERAVRAHVRALAGMVGAASLAHTIVGVSRRVAAQIKRDELARMESERKTECDRVEVTRPGVVRGFDAMYLTTGFALIAAD